MVSINWCCKQKGGIKVIEASDNLAESYIKMAEDALGTMNREKEYNIIFAISACYYSMYYSLYAVLRKIGIKCEIHSCSIEFMEKFLDDFYNKNDINLTKKAFDARNISQYYAEKVVGKKDSELIIGKAPFFVSKSKEILAKLNQEDIKRIITKLEEDINNQKKFKGKKESKNANRSLV
ncbi:MAG: HEPN domain-containing protein [Candidatus Woesearchaeota archaeon]